MYHLDDYLKGLYDNNRPKYDMEGLKLDNHKAWRWALQQAFKKNLGNMPERGQALNSKLLSTKEYDDYTLERVSFDADKGMSMPAYVVKPKGFDGKLPAIVACHGHGYGGREIVGLNPDGSDNEGEPSYQKNFALSLARKGFLVIVPELFGFGDRRLEEDRDKPLGEASCFMISTYLLMLGMTTAGLRVNDVLRSIDYLEERDDVDTDRIGSMGISGGGLVCGFSAALDDRIKVAAISGYTNTFYDSIMSIYHCVDNFIPAALENGEMYDILSLIAPKPLLIESGIKDDIFPIEATKLAYDKIAKVYELLGHEDRLDKDFFDDEHVISGAKAYDWFVRWL